MIKKGRENIWRIKMDYKKPKREDIHYRYNLPAEVTMQVDTREKFPVLFPSTVRISHPERKYRQLVVAVKMERVKLDYGDYRLKEYPNCCVVERKATQRELFKNILNSKDSVRQAKSFRKLSTCEHPYLLIEASASELLRESSDIHVDPEIFVHNLTLVIAKYGFSVLWIPWRRSNAAVRRKLGTLMVHLMLSYGIHRNLEILPELV